MADITIKLNNSLCARGFNSEERIHNVAFNRAIKMIDKQISKAEEIVNVATVNCEDMIRTYETISVLGERGAGKTSFLMSLRDEYKNKENVMLLPLIDPTLFEEKGHLFLLIISLIDIFVKEVPSTPENKGWIDEYHKFKSDLAQGLPTLDNEGLTYQEPTWHEDEYEMERVMESVSAAFNLERNFHCFVFYALKILKKKAFLLMFDDIDVDFKKGWMVLETLRKFLTSKQMIIVLSGNMKLYSKNVRKQQWHNFGKELLLNENTEVYGGRDEFYRLVNEIEGQYMQKILKSENRVYLYNLKDNIDLNGNKYQVKLIEGEQNVDKDIKEVYSDIFQKHGVKDSGALSVFISFMMTTSMRTQVHFLYNSLAEEDNLMSSISAFSSRIYAQNIDIELATNVNQFNIILLRYLIKSKLVEEAYQMLPCFESSDRNSALAGFSIIFAKLLSKNAMLPFDYLCRISMTRDNMRHLTYEEGRTNSVLNYCIAAGLFQTRDLRSIVGNVMAFAATKALAVRMDGSISLMGFTLTARGKGRLLESRIDKVMNEAGDKQKILGYLPFISLLYSNKNERLLQYSVYALLANIGQILKSGIERNTAIDAIKSACLPVSYQMRDENVINDSSDNMVVEEVDVEFNEDTIGVLADKILAWKRKYPENMIYGGYLFGRIFTRFYYTLSNIIENNKNKPLGHIFNLFVCSLMNACLIEEMKVNKQGNIAGLNVNNISTKNKILIDNIRYYNGLQERQEIIPFTRWMMACPILVPFIDTKDAEALKEFIRQCMGDIYPWVEELFTEEGCMTNLLNKVACMGLFMKPKFSASDDVIEQNIEIINNANLNVELILNGDKEAAKEELRKQFSSVSGRPLTSLRNKCIIEDNKLKRKQN